MTELAVVTILAGVLAVGIAMAALAFALFQRLESHVDDRFNQLDRRFDELAERVARLEVEQAGPEGQPDTGRASGFGRAPSSFRE